MEASAGYKQNWPIEIWGTFHVTQTQQMFLFELKRSYSHQKTSQMHFKYDISATVKKRMHSGVQGGLPLVCLWGFSECISLFGSNCLG